VVATTPARLDSVTFRSEGSSVSVERVVPGPERMISKVAGPCQYALGGVPIVLSMPGLADCRMVSDAAGNAACAISGALSSRMPRGYTAHLSVADAYVGEVVMDGLSAPIAESPTTPPPPQDALTQEQKVAIVLAICAVKLWGEEQCAARLNAGICNAAEQALLNNGQVDAKAAAQAYLVEQLTKDSEFLSALVTMAELAECAQGFASQ
jgi:hypothetical protein